MLRVALTAVVAAAFMSSTCLAQSTTNANKAIQLPRTVRPTHYDIALDPNSQALTFAGQVTVAIDVLQPTPTITLNAHELTFSSVTLTDAEGRNARPAPKTEFHPAEQTATFRFDRPVSPGSYRLTMQYTGKIGQNTSALFAIDYPSNEGTKRALYTQLALADARRVFPSWDEPDFKATFSLTATVPADQMAVSNMPIARQTPLGDGRARVEFLRTPRMSTYLLLFAVGEFERVTTKAANTEIGVVTRKGAKEQAAYALESSARALREYNEYFDAPYPLPKLDNIAVPGSSQFFAAMENWGAILTFESVILLDPSISTASDKESIFSIAAHEISHQWFGNLVTMRWWDDAWLNEGFAQWMASRTTAKLNPEWDSGLLAVGNREFAMGSDALATTHPIVVVVPSAEAANQMFDQITYLKGEAVISMLESYVGSDTWRDGVRRYMKAHAYGNTVSNDLWREIEAAAREPVTAIARDFTLQPGIPLIRVEAAKCVSGRTQMQLSQGEFSKDQPNKKPLTWRVPVIVKSVGATAPVKRLVSGTGTTIEMAGCDPVIVNAGQSGYFRTLYSPDHFAALTKTFGTIAPIDQLGILSDSWALGMSGHQSAQDAFALARATPVDAHPQLWKDIAQILGDLDGYYDDNTAAQARFREFAIKILKPVFARVGWSARAGEPHTATILRNDLIKTLGGLGDQEVINEARRLYAAQNAGSLTLSADVKKPIFGVVAQHADAKTWEALRAAARAEKTPLVKRELYLLLARAQDQALAQRTLDLALTGEAGATIGGDLVSAVSDPNPDLAFDFAIRNLDAVNGLLDSFSQSFFIPYLGRMSNDAAMVDKIRKFATEHVAADSRRLSDSMSATVADRVRVRRDRLPDIDAWLARNP